MADDNENKPHHLDVAPPLVTAIEQLHDHDSINQLLRGRDQVDFNIYYNMVILNGIKATADRLDRLAVTNERLVKLLKERSISN